MKFADALEDIAKNTTKQDFIILELTKDAEEISTEYHNKQIDLANNIPPNSRDSFRREYIVRNWQKSLKYAGLIRMSKKRLRPADERGEVLFITNEDIAMGQEIQDHNYEQFKEILIEWMGYQRSEETVLKDDFGTVLKYLSAIKSHGIISSMLLAYEVGNVTRDKEFVTIVSYLFNVGCIEPITSLSAVDICKRQGPEWTEKMLINYKALGGRGRPPVLYKFLKNLTPYDEEQIKSRGLKNI